MENLKQRIQQYNKKFDEYQNNSIKEKSSFEVIEGNIPILISAPHSVRQLREGKIKGKDSYTGAMVIEIAKQTNCFAIYKTYNNQDDASYDIENNSYKEKVLQIIRENQIQIFLDIHGAKDTEEFDVDIGTDEKQNLNGKIEILENLIKSLKENGIEKIGIDKKFKANTMHTLTKKVATNTKIACMQIEFTKKYRDISQIQNLKKALNAIINWIKNNG